MFILNLTFDKADILKNKIIRKYCSMWISVDSTKEPRQNESETMKYFK